MRRDFESVTKGERLELTRGPLTTAHLMRWSAAIENWHKIHYDQAFSVEHEKLPGLLINGSLKQQFIVSMLRNWAGETGWLWTVGFQFRAMNVAGETLTAWATVVDTHRCAAFGIVDLELGVANEHGLQSTPGTARVALPYEGQGPVTRPFNPPVELRAN